MRNYVATAVLGGLLGFAGVAQAENTGCGAGTILFEGKSGKGPEILAVTTNGFFFNQFFGITFGTLGCEEGGTISADAQRFMSENMEQVAQDAARGEGEALATLASLLEVDEADREAFYAHTQEHFSEIFPSANVTAGKALENLEASMAEDEALSRYTV